MRRTKLTPLAFTLAAVGCFGSLNPRDYSSSSALYAAGLERYQKGKWGDAVSAFDRLTLDLPARDTLLPRAHWYLGNARLKRQERLLAVQAFIRLAESFPDDTLADDALYLAGRAYTQLWKDPSLDPQYGTLAQTQFRLLASVYPNSPYVDSAAARLKGLEEMFAGKDYETAVHYMRRKAYDSAILYLRAVVETHPNTDKARLAMLRLVEVYRLPAINYREDAAEVCATLRAGFPADPDVIRLCKLSPGDTTVARR